LQERGIPLYPVSAATGEGLPVLLEAVWRALARRTEGGVADSDEPHDRQLHDRHG